MNQMTPWKERGTKFEIWLELLLKAKGYQNVLRDVCYHKSKYVYRQLDLQYNLVKQGKIHTVGIEAKYSSNGKIPFKFRSSTKEKAGQLIRINNLVDEVFERQRFCDLNNMILVTNKEFDSKIIKHAGKYGIILMEGDSLQKIFTSLGYKGSIANSISTVDIEKYNLAPNRLYL